MYNETTKSYKTSLLLGKEGGKRERESITDFITLVLVVKCDPCCAKNNNNKKN